MKLRIGTSGFSYKEWKGGFYPEDLPAKEWLRFYAERLPAVEINNTFYRMPKASVLAGWAAAVPEDFRFSIKASRRITHIKRLKDADDETDYLLRTLETLGERLGVLLFQLPPYLRKDLPRLERFLDRARGAPAALEFRHESWIDDDVLACLRERDVALCVSETDEAPAPQLVETASRGYLRLRRSDYPESDLAEWSLRLRASGFGEAFVFFKHEVEAPRLAETLRALTTRVAPVRPRARAVREAG